MTADEMLDWLEAHDGKLRSRRYGYKFELCFFAHGMGPMMFLGDSLRECILLAREYEIANSKAQQTHELVPGHS